MKTKKLRSFALSTMGTTVTVYNGCMFAYGNIGYLDKPKTFTFIYPVTTQYHFIYGEIDKSVIPNSFAIKVKNNQSNGNILPTTFRQDMLRTVKVGVFQLPLYRIKLNSSGIEEVQDLRNFKDYPQRAYSADSTKRITGSIASNVTARTQSISDNSKKVATTLFVHNAVRNYIDR